METIRAEIDCDIHVDFTEHAASAMPSMHYHNCYEIDMLEKGRRTYLINDTLTELCPHDVMLIQPNEIHCTAGGAYTRYLIHFSEKYIQRYFTKEAAEMLLTCFAHKKIHMKTADFDMLLRLTRELRRGEDNFVVFSQILTLIQQNVSTDVSFVSSKNKTLSEIIEYISEHYLEIEGLEEIAARFSISKFYLCRLFKENTGTSVMKYIHILKIQTACDLLFQTKKSVEEIAELCGFHSSMYFCRAFKEVVGTTPTQYRRTKDRQKQR